MCVSENLILISLAFLRGRLIDIILLSNCLIMLDKPKAKFTIKSNILCMHVKNACIFMEFFMDFSQMVRALKTNPTPLNCRSRVPTLNLLSLILTKMAKPKLGRAEPSLSMYEVYEQYHKKTNVWILFNKSKAWKRSSPKLLILLATNVNNNLCSHIMVWIAQYLPGEDRGSN